VAAPPASGNPGSGASGSEGGSNPTPAADPGIVSTGEGAPAQEPIDVPASANNPLMDLLQGLLGGNQSGSGS
jgi:hypothetical protein